MNMRHSFLMIFLCITSSYLSSQALITFNKRLHDFGTIANLNFPPAAFIFKNSGNQNLAILKIDASPTVKVNFPRKFIAPGDSAIIYVWHNNNELGPFSENLSITSNSGNTASIITVKGINTTVQNCFPVKDDPDKKELRVLDKITKEPVPSASVSIKSAGAFQEGRCNRLGRMNIDLPPGSYRANVSASGYRDLTTSVMIRRSIPIIFIEIEPLSNAQIPVVEEEIPVPIIDTTPKPTSNSTPNNVYTELPEQYYAPNNIVLLIDVSLSMKADKKLENLKAAIQETAKNFRTVDQISIITYCNTSFLLAENINGAEQNKLIAIIDTLTPRGSTNGVKGLESAYMLINKYYIAQGNNQILLATDGKFSGSLKEETKMMKKIEQEALNGIKLSIMGFGLDRSAMERMRLMTEKGNGRFIPMNVKENKVNQLLDEIKISSKK